MDNVLVYYLCIPVVIEVHNHRFEIYTLVSEIHENVDLVLGIKNIFELEGIINSRDCRFEFLNRSVPTYPFVDKNFGFSNNQDHRQENQ